MEFESMGSCYEYLTGEATIKINLPAARPTCQYCKFISNHPAYDRYYCKITEEYLFDWKKTRGLNCPFDFEKRKGNEHGNHSEQQGHSDAQPGI